jgi:hypothetical protein
MACAVEEENEVIAACALCPNEDCGSVVISYRTYGKRDSDPWDFKCSRCGTDFSAPQEEVGLHSVAVGTLLEKSLHMTHA